MQKNDTERMFASRRQEIESQPHKAKSAIAHIAYFVNADKIE